MERNSPDHSKNIVICCDGTNNEFSGDETNIVKLLWCLQRNPKQVVYYHPGVGTAGEIDRNILLGRLTQGLKKVLGSGFGYGVLSNLARCYKFLMDTYEPGDRIFVFGFSRGAYTARALCGFIHMFGLFDKGNSIIVEYAMKVFKNPKKMDFALAARFKDTFGNPVEIDFVGVWDSVNSTGTILNLLKVPYTRKNPSIKVGRHALAIDEYRCRFAQNTWSSDPSNKDLKEVWFAGAHSDVGGGYLEERSHLSKISLEWMILEARKSGLLLDEVWVKKVLAIDSKEFAPPDFKGIIHKSLTNWWKLIEIFPMRRWDYTKKRNNWYWPLCRGRIIPEGSTLHQSVIDRMGAPELKYKPKNLPKEFKVLK